MDDDLADDFEAVLRRILPTIRQSSEGSIPTQLPDEAIIEGGRWFMSAAQVGTYEISNGVVAMFLAQLLSPTATHLDWLLGRVLGGRLFRQFERELRQLGAPTNFERAMIFFYVEWRERISEMPQGDAFEEAATLFNVPEARIHRWYNHRTGQYAQEQAFAANLVRRAARRA